MTEQQKPRWGPAGRFICDGCTDLAAEITRLRAERDRLRAALKQFVHVEERRGWESDMLDQARAAVAAVEDRR